MHIHFDFIDAVMGGSLFITGARIRKRIRISSKLLITYSKFGRRSF
jgi:hypothetical protein